MDIILDHISKAYGEKQVLRALSQSFPQGQISCILGASGCGKTTLLRLVAGLEAPDSGAITGLEGKKISAVFQEDRLIENLSAEKNVLLTARRGFTRRDAHSLLDALGLADSAGKAVRSLSGGMKRRTAVARALAADYDLLLLDEPLSGLDSDTRASVMDVIARSVQGRTVIWVTHDPNVARRLGAVILRL